MSDGSQREPGWYPDENMAGTQRYWDGAEWTDHVAPVGDSTPAPADGEPAVDPFESRLKIGCFGLVIVVVLVGVILGVLGGDDEGESGAKVACEDFVKDRLKSPGSADFSDTTASESSTGLWTVRGSVDSENSFSAEVRNTYVCSVRHLGEGEWTLSDLSMSSN